MNAFDPSLSFPSPIIPSAEKSLEVARPTEMSSSSTSLSKLKVLGHKVPLAVFPSESVTVKSVPEQVHKLEKSSETLLETQVVGSAVLSSKRTDASLSTKPDIVYSFPFCVSTYSTSLF